VKKLGCSSVLALAMVCGTTLSAAPASAQTAEGWLWYKKNDFALSAPMLGVMAYTGAVEKAAFGIFIDFDYHLTPEMAVGALVDLGFGSNFSGFDFGPQYKYKFKLGSSSHFPYVRAGLPMRLMIPSNDFTGSTTLVAIGVLLGGGYRYFFHRRIGVGADLSFVPTIKVSGGDNLPGLGTFTFGIHFAVGVDFKF
jgi:hypothetical protein